MRHFFFGFDETWTKPTLDLWHARRVLRSVVYHAAKLTSVGSDDVWAGSRAGHARFKKYSDTKGKLVESGPHFNP